MTTTDVRKPERRIPFSSLGLEPFRIFCPTAVLAGIIGVVLWPLYLWNILEWYPGLIHSRIMVSGFFGGFILGFLGTAMPRMLSANPFRTGEVLVLVLIHAAMVISFAAGKVLAGDMLLLILLLSFFGCVGIRAKHRTDTPPPGFVLVGLALICLAAGTVITILEEYLELDFLWITLQRLLSNQGFVLLPILGIGPFILPRFFGLESHHDFPEALAPTAGWWKKAFVAASAGILIISTFVVEASGWPRTAHAARFLTTLVYLFLEMPFQHDPKAGNPFGTSIRLALAAVLAGFLPSRCFPASGSAFFISHSSADSLSLRSWSRPGSCSAIAGIWTSSKVAIGGC
jgi:uncharacterized protein involved in response to NO